MHLLSSPAHLFTVVLLSIVLGVMTMAVPLTVHNPDIGKWQWHSKRRFMSETKVYLIRRIDQSHPPAKDDHRMAIRTTILHGHEHWYLYISTKHSFYAVQDDELKLWRVRKVDNGKIISSGFILGNLDYDPDKTFQDRTALMNDLFSKIQTITGPSQFEALDAVIDLLKADSTPKGLEYKPDLQNPDAWTKIFLAMTNYDQYRQKFPNVPARDRYMRPTGEATDVQQAASILMGMSQLPTTSGGHWQRNNRRHKEMMESWQRRARASKSR
ncbi:hypothetical protein F5890DRAFT_1538482 [Lentinula detonsa]|uniref:Uncharacterized protein n=1 Tax=Lentinula detonsa TaxID=2804962 RepID=A0AA38PTJ7_9AGAR|nr:hypothetical protein F5890DRAFT_1538482 [Lentinula detonsa]